MRVAYNEQGFVTMGYRTAQNSVGEEWLLLEVGLTMRAPAKDYTLKREHLSVKTPDGTVVPLASQREYAEAGHLMALNNRAKVVRDISPDLSRALDEGFTACARSKRPARRRASARPPSEVAMGTWRRTTSL